MPITTTTQIEITCDNPTCPGNRLDPASYEGWLLISAAMHQATGDSGMMLPATQQYVFCSSGCLATFSADHESTPTLVAPDAPPTP